ncbi:MAG: PhoPQ-activated protein PqaA family protein, partial [Pirellulaceae bacterium]|nr:PhoPQ-activated protein PqaA family protein [Pirellulaceae bacterium]
LPDSSRFYFDELRGEKHLCYVPNANHSLKGTKAIETLIAFHRSIVENQERPEYEWKFVDDGGIRVTTKTSAQRVLLWQANNPAARDFRIMSIGRAYQSSELEMDERGVYYGRVEKPAKGWTAFFIQIEYAAGASTTMRVTSGVRVTPDTLPFSEKQAPLSD